MADEDAAFTVEVVDGETLIEMTGDRDTAVVVRSASGERIYLPPEDFERPPETSDSPYQSARSDSPYQSARNDSPYQSARDDSPYQSARSDSPYQSARDDSPYQSARQQFPDEGLRSTRDGYAIRHPEPATDVRLLR
jgi:hypothetical protein